MPPSSLLSNHKASDSGLQVLLHPLVLLTISDYITRHTLRRQAGPIVGALLGQQNGRDISLEHAFDCKVVLGEGGEVLMHQTWFEDRLQQFKDVHKAPALELVGWFTVAPTSGPDLDHLSIHRQILHTYNESAVLLAFHPSVVAEGATTGGKLPLTIYESVYEDEGITARDSGDEDKAMQIEGQETHLNLKFRELPYSVETGEAEMISVDFVARGGGNATAVDGTTKKATDGQASQTPVPDTNTQEKSERKETNGIDSSLLSPEDEELIASLTARANAVKMLHSRIQLLRSYLSSLPPSYLNTPTPTPTSTSESTFTDLAQTATLPSPTEQPQPQPEPQHQTEPQPHHAPLRAISSLLNRLPLLLPPTDSQRPSQSPAHNLSPTHNSSFQTDLLAEKSDVSLVALLGALAKSTKDARELGRKFAIVEHGRVVAGKRMDGAGRVGMGMGMGMGMGEQGAFGGGGFGAFGAFDGRGG